MIDGRRPIHYAADYGQKEIIEYLIQLGSNVNVSVFVFVSDVCSYFDNLFRFFFFGFSH